MKNYRTVLLLSTFLVNLFLLVLHAPVVHAREALPVVRAVLFYSPTCPHCHYVITETLPPLAAKYGDQLQILGVDVTQSSGETLFLAALQKFGLESGGVPFLVVGDTYLVGSGDIPEKFPGVIDAYLAEGGVDWPDIPGLADALPPELDSAADPEGHVPDSVAGADAPLTTIPERGLGWRENFVRDLPGNSLAMLVLAGMLAAFTWSIRAFSLRRKTVAGSGAWKWRIPLLSVIGFGVAGYLSYIELTQASAVCGPVGDCNLVQQSPYAWLFGVLPVGLLGMLGYLVILTAWVVRQNVYGRSADFFELSLFTMTLIGTLFSIYLTFLEPFVIGASCAWCLTSALIMTILMLISTRPAAQAYARFARRRGSRSGA